MKNKNASFTPVQLNLEVKMADGVRLATDVYLSAKPQAAAVILIRTPYGKAEHLQEGLGWAARGFNCVVQDVRGRYESEGDWQPYQFERQDGLAMLNWLLEQPWNNRQIVLMGSSYAAFAAWGIAVSQHSALKALVSIVPAMGLPTVQFGDNGIFQLASRVAWWSNRGAARTQRPGLLEAMLTHQPDLFYHLPVAELPSRLWLKLPQWATMLEDGPDYQPEYLISDEELARVNIPVLHIGGWHDAFIEQTLHQWRTAGVGLVERPSQALIIGPWPHEVNTVTTYGERDYGSQARISLGKFQAQWLKQTLNNEEFLSLKSPSETTTRIFLMGQNKWLEGEHWLINLSQAQKISWYAAASNTLALRPAVENGDYSFEYDPANPFPTRYLPLDESRFPARNDLLTFTTAPLAQTLSWVGVPEVTLYAATDAPDTDWAVRLLEIAPDGKIWPLGTAIINTGRYLNQPEHAGDRLVSGRVYCYQLKLNPTAISLEAGQRLRLEITSSNFPHYARNLNTGLNRYTSTAMQIAHQTIYFGPDTPTALYLPLPVISEE